MQNFNRGPGVQQMSLQTYEKYPAPRNWKKNEFMDIQTNVKGLPAPSKSVYRYKKYLALRN